MRLNSRCSKTVDAVLALPSGSPAHANYLSDEFKRVFRWASSQEWLPVTVYQALATVPGLRKGRTEAREAGPVLPVWEATVNANLPPLPPIVADMARLQRLTGARPGEICQLRPCEVDNRSRHGLTLGQETFLASARFARYSGRHVRRYSHLGPD